MTRLIQNIPTPIKNFLLRILRRLEISSGIVVSMRAKIMTPASFQMFQRNAARSFCPISHFHTSHLALQYLDKNDIEGDVVLCGVASGGLAKYLYDLMPPGRTLWLYDTYDGGTLPGEMDGEFERTQGDRIKRIMGGGWSYIRRVREAADWSAPCWSPDQVHHWRHT